MTVLGIIAVSIVLLGCDDRGADMRSQPGLSVEDVFFLPRGASDRLKLSQAQAKGFRGIIAKFDSISQAKKEYSLGREWGFFLLGTNEYQWQGYIIYVTDPSNGKCLHVTDARLTPMSDLYMKYSVGGRDRVNTRQWYEILELLAK